MSDAVNEPTANADTSDASESVDESAPIVFNKSDVDSVVLMLLTMVQGNTVNSLRRFWCTCFLSLAPLVWIFAVQTCGLRTEMAIFSVTIAWAFHMLPAHFKDEHEIRKRVCADIWALASPNIRALWKIWLRNLVLYVALFALMTAGFVVIVLGCPYTSNTPEVCLRNRLAAALANIGRPAYE